MNALNNLRTGTKLVGGFLIVAVLIALVGVIGNRAAGSISTSLGVMYEDHLKPTQSLGVIDTAQANVRGHVYRFIVASEDRARLQESIAAETRTVNAEVQKLQAAALTPEQKAQLTTFTEGWNEYQRAVSDVLRLVSANRTSEALPSLSPGGATIVARDRLSAALKSLSASMISLAEAQRKEADGAASRATTLLIVVTVVGMLLALGFGLLLSRSITQPLANAARMLEEMAKGHLGARLAMTRKDEIGEMAGTLDRFADDLQRNVVGTMRRIAEGDVSVDVGAKDAQDEIGPALEQMTLAVRGMVKEVETLALAAVDGKLAMRANASAFKGVYREVIAGVNETLDAVIGPLNVAAEYMDRISKGDIPPRITDNYSGDFNEIKNNLNVCIDAVNGLVRDVNSLSKAAIEGRLAVRADATKHGGDFRKVVEGVNGTLDAVIGPLNVAAEYVDRISKGDIPPKITDNYAGDFNEIKNNLNGCIDGLGGLVEADAVLQKMAVNDLTQPVSGNYQGVFADVAKAVNEVRSRIDNVVQTVVKISRGDLSNLEKFKAIGNGTGRRSEHDQLVPSMIQMMEAVALLVKDAEALGEAAVQGRLATRADAKRHQGDFRTVIEGVNATLDAVIGPLNVAAEYVDRISKGDVPPKITDTYAGDFNEIKNNLNNCIDGLGGLVAANAVLQRMAQNDYTAQVDARYLGIFGQVAAAANDITSRLLNVQNVAVHVADGDLQDLEKFKAIGRRSENDRLVPSFTAMMEAIRALVVDSEKLGESAVAGQLKVRADASKHQGEFRQVIEGFNRTLDAVTLPIHEAADVLEKVAEQDLRVTVNGTYAGDHAAIKTSINTMVGDLRSSMGSIAQNAQSVGDASEELDAISQQMATNAEETAAQTGVVSAASEQVSKNLTVVATSSEEMLASIREIAKSANEAAKMAKAAVTFAQATNETVQKLGESSNEIGNVINVITSIAEQTNLLALNATIEAARAGDAGKGFAVVANEVKELAKQTAQATEEISKKITGIQGETKGAVDAIGQIVETITQIDSVSDTIASAVEEQTATTNEIGRNITEAARGAEEIARNVSSVSEAARSTSQGAADTQKAARSLTEMAAQLRGLVGRFSI